MAVVLSALPLACVRFLMRLLVQPQWITDPMRRQLRFYGLAEDFQYKKSTVRENIVKSTESVSDTKSDPSDNQRDSMADGHTTVITEVEVQRVDYRKTKSTEADGDVNANSTIEALPPALENQKFIQGDVEQAVKLKDTDKELTFHISPTTLAKCKEAEENSIESFWTHELYEGPKGEKVIVEYTANISDGEVLAKKFLGEPVLGFDMEWEYGHLKGQKDDWNIALIQMACETRIGLFHIARHKGDRLEDKLAPTLRVIIEDMNVLKVGSCITKADFSRLRNRFEGLNPRNPQDLGPMHKEIFSTYPRKNISLAGLVKWHCNGLTLSKERTVRSGQWSRQLNEKQIRYAAADAYASFVVYHIMAPQVKAIQESNASADAAVEENTSTEVTESQNSTVTPRKESQTHHSTLAILRRSTSSRVMDLPSAKLYEALRLSRNSFAKRQGKLPYDYGKNQTLEDIACACPRTEEELKNIDGLEQHIVDDLGAEWLAIIDLHLADGTVPSDLEKKEYEDSVFSMHIFTALRESRNARAAQLKLRPFQLAYNRHLEVIAQKRPRSIAEMRALGGLKGMRWATLDGLEQEWIKIIEGFVADEESTPPSQVETKEDGEEAPAPADPAPEIGQDGLTFDTLMDISEEDVSEEQTIRNAQDDSRDNCTHVAGVGDMKSTGSQGGVRGDLLPATAANRPNSVDPQDLLLLEELGEDDGLPTENVPLGSLPNRLLEELRILRSGLSQKLSLPQESIASDKTLQELSLRRPQVLPDLVVIPGASHFDRICKQNGMGLIAHVKEYLDTTGEGLSQVPATASPMGTPVPGHTKRFRRVYDSPVRKGAISFGRSVSDKTMLNVGEPTEEFPEGGTKSTPSKERRYSEGSVGRKRPSHQSSNAHMFLSNKKSRI